MNRCKWAMNVNEIYTKYHDEEWGEPIHDDQKLYEMLILESFQAGLSWSCILKKRENFRKAFDNFDINKIINYDENKIKVLQNNEGIIRNKLKIKATINNSKIFKQIQKEYGSFDKYIWNFTNNETIYELDKVRLENKDIEVRVLKIVINNEPLNKSQMENLKRVVEHATEDGIKVEAVILK